MVGTKNHRVYGDIHGLFERGAIGHLTDAQLLDLVCRQCDADLAFETLILRHGPTVLRTCRKILGDHNDADDAFQATFLVLARRANSVHPAQSIGPWLYGVARRISLKARTAAIRRRMHERQFAVSVLFDPEPRFELSEELHEEIARLPEHLKAPVALCYLEQMSYVAAASALGVTEGTIRGRLAKARNLLKRRLTNDACLRHPTSPRPASNDQKPIVPLILLDATKRAAIAFALRTEDQPKIAASILRLAYGALEMMFVSRIVRLAVAIAFLGIAGTAFVALESACSRAVLANAAQGRSDSSPSKSASGAPAPRILAQADLKKDAIYDIAIQGKAIEIEPKTVEIRVDGPGKFMIWVDRGFLNESDDKPSDDTKRPTAKSPDAATTSPAKVATSINPQNCAPHASRKLLTIRWTGSMRFIGKTTDPDGRPSSQVVFLGRVNAETEGASLDCEKKLILFTDQVVPLERIHAAAGAISSEKLVRDPSSKLSIVQVFGKVVFISRARSPEKPAWHDQEKIEADGPLFYDSRSGAVRIIGSGRLYSFDPPPPGSPLESGQVPTPVKARISFEKGMSGKRGAGPGTATSGERLLDFSGDVELIGKGVGSSAMRISGASVRMVGQRSPRILIDPNHD